MSTDLTDQKVYFMTRNWKLFHLFFALFMWWYELQLLFDIIYFLEGKPSKVIEGTPIFFVMFLLPTISLSWDILFSRLITYPHGIEIRSFLSKKWYYWEDIDEPKFYRKWISFRWSGTPLYYYEHDWKNNTLGELLRQHRPDFFTEENPPKK